MFWCMLVLGCESATPGWDLLAPFGAVEPVALASPEAPTVDAEELEEAEEALSEILDEELGEADDEDFDNPFGPNAASGDPEVAVEPGEAEEIVVEPELVLPAPAGHPAPFGLPTNASWGVRLLGTIAQAQPPRAALGLPDGREVVVAPGSMLPSVGMVVIAVGQDSVQLARVTPAGDHAEVEMVNLVAQYSRTVGTAQ